MIDDLLKDFTKNQQGVMAITGECNSGKSLLTLKTIIDTLNDDRLYSATSPSDSISQLAYLLGQEKFIYYFSETDPDRTINSISHLLSNKNDLEIILKKFSIYVKCYKISDFTYKDIITICKEASKKSLIVIDGVPREELSNTSQVAIGSRVKELTHFVNWAQQLGVPIIMTVQSRNSISNPYQNQTIPTGIAYSASVILKINKEKSDLNKSKINVLISKNKSSIGLPNTNHLVNIKIKKLS